MKLELYAIPAELPQGGVDGRHVVVIDVLRASSTIVHACENGIERILPVADVDEARHQAAALDGKTTLLGGERGGKKLEGFDLGNSPAEYRAERIVGKSLVFTTSNGTGAIGRCRGARQIIVGCFLNAGAVIRHLLSEEAEAVAILCAGHLGRFALEDFVCGGLLVERLDAARPVGLMLDDAARAARELAVARESAGDVVRESAHGQRLASLGFGADLDFCSRTDVYETVPVVSGGALVPF